MREVHREVVKDRKLAEAIQKLGSIRYTDGTKLYLFVRELNRSERVKAMDSYGSLIRDCIKHGVDAVSELPTAREVE
jgi:hypothetical protein